MDLKNAQNDKKFNKFTIPYLKNMKKDIAELQEDELIEVLNYIKKDNIKYTENNNGVFVNMTKLSYQTLQQIEKFIIFCQQNKKTLNNDTDFLNDIKNLI
jgi:hypothetical protein